MVTITNQFLPAGVYTMISRCSDKNSGYSDWITISTLSGCLDIRSLAFSWMAKNAWASVGPGYIAIGHKPGSRISFTGLKRASTTMVLTLLLEHEGAIDIEKHMKQLNIEWIWFLFSASNPPAGKRINEVFKLLEYLEQSLNSGNKIYIHCSGGIHRTGIITYGFLRYVGKEKEKANNILNDLRSVTSVII